MYYFIRISPLFFIPLLAFCKMKEEPEPLEPNIVDTFLANLVWRVPITPDTGEMIIDEVIVTQEDFIYVQDKEGYEDVLTCVNIKTGQKKWTWDDPDITSGYDITSMNILDNQLVVESWADLYIINISTGNTIWKSKADQTGHCGAPRASIVGNYIYFVTEDCSASGLYSQIMRTPIQQFSPEVVYRVDQITTPGIDSGLISNVKAPVLWMDENSDSILIFQSRYYKLLSLHEKVDLFAYNLNKHELKWKINAVVAEGNSSIMPPIVDGNDIYFLGEGSIQKIDAKLGKVIWSTPFLITTEHFYYSTIALVDNMIYAHPGANRFYALNAYNGKEEWQISDLGCCGTDGSMQYVEPYLYYVTPPYFVRMDIKNAELASKMKSPFDNPRGGPSSFSQFTQTFLSEDKSLIITSDSHYLIAVKPH